MTARRTERLTDERDGVDGREHGDEAPVDAAAAIDKEVDVVGVPRCRNVFSSAGAFRGALESAYRERGRVDAHSRARKGRVDILRLAVEVRSLAGCELLVLDAVLLRGGVGGQAHRVGRVCRCAVRVRGEERV